MALIESIPMSLSIPNRMLLSYVKALSERFFFLYFSKILPVALIESITMSLPIHNGLLVSYVPNFI